MGKLVLHLRIQIRLEDVPTKNLSNLLEDSHHKSDIDAL